MSSPYTGVWRVENYTTTSEEAVHWVFIDNLVIRYHRIGDRIYNEGGYTFEIKEILEDGVYHLDLLPVMSAVVDEDDQVANDAGYPAGQQFLLIHGYGTELPFRSLVVARDDHLTIVIPQSSSDARPVSVPDGAPSSGRVVVLRRQSQAGSAE